MRKPFLGSLALAGGLLLSSSMVASVAGAEPAVAAGPIVLSQPGSLPVTNVTMEGAVFGNNEYMAMWGTGDSLVVQTFDTGGSPTGTSGNYIADNAVLGSATLTYDGSSYRAFWSRGGATGVCSAKVSADGSLAHMAVGAPASSVSGNFPVWGACASTGECAAAWSSQDGAINAVRFDANGDPIDSAPIVLSSAVDGGTPAPGAVQIARIASGYLVVSQPNAEAGNLYVQAFSPTFAPLAAPIAVSAANTTPAVVGGSGSAAIVAWSAGGVVTVMRFDGTGTPLDAAPVPLATGGPVTSAASTSYGFAISVGGYAPSLDAQILEVSSAGALLHAAPLPLAGYPTGALYGGFVASDGPDAFVVATTGWQGTDGLPAFRARVNDSGTAVLPATSIANGYVPENGPDVAWAGTAFIAGWTTPGSPAVFPLATVTTGGQVSALPTYMPTDGEALGYAIASNGTGYALFRDDWRDAEEDVSPSLASVPSAVAYVSVNCQDSHGDVSIASDGSHYFSVYGCWGGNGSNIVGMLSDGQGSSAVTIPIAVTTNLDAPFQSAVAWNGTTYVVTWVATTVDADGATPVDVHAAFYDATGKLTAGPVNVSDGGGDADEVTVGCATGSCVFAWTTANGIWTRKVDAAGVPMGAAAAIPSTNTLRTPRVAWDGQEYVLAAAATPATGVGPDDLVATWLDASGAATAGGFTTVATGVLGAGIPMRLASDRAGNTAVVYTRFREKEAVAYVLGAAATDGDAGVADGGDEEAGPADAGGTARDGGHTSGSDAGVRSEDAGADASAPEKAAAQDSGCGCSAAGAPSAVAPLSAIALLAMLAALCVRRPRRSRARRVR